MTKLQAAVLLETYLERTRRDYEGSIELRRRREAMRIALDALKENLDGRPIPRGRQKVQDGRRG